MRHHLYILNDNGDPVGVEDVRTWGLWFETNEEARVVARTRLCEIPEVDVSTVFLGLDHAWGDDEAPKLFETMIFRQGRGEAFQRCSTREQALEAHALCVDRVLKMLEEGTLGLENDMEEALQQAEQAIEQVKDWKREQLDERAVFYSGTANGWNFRVVEFDVRNPGFPEGRHGVDGAGGKDLLALHLTRDLAEKALKLAKEQLSASAM
jgi:hypothetical protein